MPRITAQVAKSSLVAPTGPSQAKEDAPLPLAAHHEAQFETLESPDSPLQYPTTTQPSVMANKLATKVSLTISTLYMLYGANYLANTIQPITRSINESLRHSYSSLDSLL